MPVDKWGIPFFYPTKTTAGVSGSGTGFFYEQSNDILDDDNFNGEGDVTNSANGQWTFNTNGATSVQIFKNSDTANSIGGCDMDFEERVNAGYAYRVDDPRDIELKFLIKFVDSASDNGFAIEGPTGRHTSDGCCQGFAYKLDIEYLTDPAQFRFRKEMYHVINSNDPKTGVWTHPLADFQLLGHSDWVGIGYVHYVKIGGATGTGHNTDNSVVLEMWFNPDPETNPNNWTMLKRTEDKGGWGSGGGLCNGDNDQIGAWSNSNFRIKSNDEGGEFLIKHLSLREIDPTKSFDDDPETPPPGEGPTNTQTIQGNFTLKWDLNTSRTSACAGSGGGGGAGGLAKFYEKTSSDPSDKELSNTTTFDNRKRITMKAANSSSVFYGKTPKQLDIPLKKVGTPGASPVINVKIWNSSGTVVYTSTTNLDPSTLTTSYVSKSFNMSTNTHTLGVGDRIGVEYITSSGSNYVVVGYSGTSTANTTYEQYEGSTWQTKTRSIVMTVWE